jgi:hypothetical protein
VLSCSGFASSSVATGGREDSAMGDEMDYAACRMAVGHLWTSLRAVLDALPPRDARPAFSPERSVLRQARPPLEAMLLELERLCHVTDSVLGAHPDIASSERLARSVRHLKADHAIALGILRTGPSDSGVVVRGSLEANDVVGSGEAGVSRR